MNPHRIFAVTTEDYQESNHVRYLRNGVLLLGVVEHSPCISFHGYPYDLYPVLDISFEESRVRRLWWREVDEEPAYFSKLQEYVSP